MKENHTLRVGAGRFGRHDAVTAASLANHAAQLDAQVREVNAAANEGRIGSGPAAEYRARAELTLRNLRVAAEMLRDGETPPAIMLTGEADLLQEGRALLSKAQRASAPTGKDAAAARRALLRTMALKHGLPT